MRNLPTTAKEANTPKRHRGRVYATVCGFVYMLASVSCSSWYLTLVQPHLENDIWWPHFNATGVQTFLGDIVHSRMNLQRPQDTFLLLASNPPTLFQRYGQESTTMTVPPSSPRTILLGDIPFEGAILAIRSESLDTSLAYRTPFCWADFGRAFEMAHTIPRQQRCLQRDADNAAVFLESVLRNVNASDILDWELFDMLNQTLFTPLLDHHHASGAAWVASILTRHSLLPVSDEAAAWMSHGLARFTLQLQNKDAQLVEASILIEDALGIQQKITIRSIPPSSQAMPTTTSWTSLSLTSDMNAAASFSMSLVRGGLTDANALGLDWDTDILFPAGQGVPGMDLLRSHVGPLGSIDIRTIHIPPALAEYFLTFRESLYAFLESGNSSLLASYAHLTEPLVDPVPPTWGNLSYYGGNPMCPFMSAQSFVQPSFGITDDCTAQVPYAVHFRRESVVFALISSGLSMDQLGFVCNFSSTSSDQCLATLLAVLPLVTMWNESTAFGSQYHPPITAMSNLNISFMQFASAIDDTTRQSFLLQPLVAANDMWSFYGWVGIHEWLSGRREVYSFEGDIATLTVLTEPQDELALVANDLEISRKGCYYIWYITVYITYVLVAIVTLMILYGFYIGFHVEWWNLFMCNWVIGCVWIGRPFLFLRGITAMLLLSSGSLAFIRHDGFSSLVAAPPTLFNTMVVAGEATWLTVVLHDFLLPFSDPDVTLHAPISTALVWVVLTIIQATTPHTVSISLHPTCTYSLLGIQATCTSGVVQFGSLTRLGWLCLVHVACIVVVYLVVKVYFATTRRHKGMVHGVPHILLPGIVHAFFVESGHGDIYLDKVACVMCGMVSYKNTLFHIPSWTRLTKPPTLHGVGYMFQVAKLSVPVRNMQKLEHIQQEAPCSSIMVSSVELEHRQATEQHHKYIRWVGLFGLAHMGASVAGSYGYLESVRTVMANDFWWAGFNATGHQTYLSNWFNRQLQLGSNISATTTLVTALEFGEVGTSNDYSTLDTVVYVAPLYASAIQLEVNTLSNVITGLRAMQGCDVPWIATAYCYV
ncbi:hypothetical protein DYB31_013925, partial [Aphanomyces astaci]